jgi:hypothetical protein
VQSCAECAVQHAYGYQVVFAHDCRGGWARFKSVLAAAAAISKPAFSMTTSSFGSSSRPALAIPSLRLDRRRPFAPVMPMRRCRSVARQFSRSWAPLKLSAGTRSTFTCGRSRSTRTAPDRRQFQVPGRLGHDYENFWSRDRSFIWHGKTGASQKPCVDSEPNRHRRFQHSADRESFVTKHISTSSAPDPRSNPASRI